MTNEQKEIKIIKAIKEKNTNGKTTLKVTVRFKRHRADIDLLFNPLSYLELKEYVKGD